MKIILGISRLIIPKIYSTIKAMETPGFNKELAQRQKSSQEERSRERRFLRRLLPLDLQLKFEPRGKWNFDGELLRRRNSEIKEDKSFFDFLAKDKDLISSGPLVADSLKEIVQDRNAVIADLVLVKALYGIKADILQDQGEAIGIGKILAKQDPQFARDLVNLLVNKGGVANLYEGVEIALGDKEVAEKNLQIFFDEEEYAWAGKIALELGNLDLAKKALGNLYEEEIKRGDRENKLTKKLDLTFFSPSLGELGQGVAEKDPEFGKEILEKLLAKNRIFEAAKVAVGLGNLELAEKLRSDLHDKDLSQLGWEIGRDLAKRDLDFGWKWMERNFAYGDPTLPGIAAGNIAVVLAESHKLTGEQLTKIKEIRDKFIEFGGHESRFIAGKISLAINDMESFYKTNDLLDEIDSGPARYRSNKLSLAFLNKIEFAPATRRLVGALSGVTKEKSYATEMMLNLLSRSEDLSALQSKYLPTFLALKDYGTAINTKMDADKKWENPELFFEVYGDMIADLQFLDNNAAGALVRSLLSRGFSFAQNNVLAYQGVLEDKKVLVEIGRFLSRQGEKLPYYELGKLLEVGSGYVASGRGELLVSLLNQYPSYKEVVNILNGKLFEIITKEVGVKGEFSPESLERWPLKFLPNLINHYQFLKPESRTTQELYSGILKAVFENRFSEFIADEEQEEKLGKKIASHNKRVESLFSKAGINWEAWENFSGQETAEVVANKKISKAEIFDGFNEKLGELHKLFEGTSLAGGLRKDIITLQKEKKKFDFSGIDLADPEWQRKFFPNYFRGLEYVLLKNPNFVLPDQVGELWNQLKEFIGAVQGKGADQHSKKGFIVKKWDRDPRHDLFQGNYSGCCISIGDKGTSPQHLPGTEFETYPPGILDFLVDKGVQVAEVIDEEIGEPIGQCWLFVSSDKNGEPVLVADTFDVKASYGVGANVNRGIREAMFSFLKAYAEAVGIKKVVLGKKWGNGDPIINKVEVGDLPKANLPPIKKLGGYVNKRQYYLETTDSKEAYLIE